MENISIAVIGFAGFSGSGKTTLIKKVIPVLKSKGLRVAVLKHAHHEFDVDVPGKDSYEIRKAGADQVLVASQQRWALMVETPENDADPSLEYLINQLDSSKLDLVLVEGFKTEAHPKIEVHRSDSKNEYLYPGDPDIVAIATDSKTRLDVHFEQLNLNDPEAVCEFILSEM